MMEHFDDFVERVRDANPIEEVLEECGIKLRGHGRLRTAAQHDSLKVRTDMQRMFWYSQNWNGDVFAWIMKDKGVEFTQALEILARRAHLEMPRFQQVNESEVKRSRATADVFSVAADVFHRWLVTEKSGDAKSGDFAVRGDEEALAYAKGRGWTDETLKAALVGFSGRKTPEQLKDIRGEFQLYGIDLLSPAAVAILGFEGDVGEWARKYDLRSHPDFDDGWLEKKRIHGLMDTPGLIYVHQFQGGVRYLSRRQLPGFDKIKAKSGDPKSGDFDSGGKAREWKSFNPYKCLAGAKQAYFNHVHRMDAALVCVEGQGDAVTFGQWGQGCMAFCGLLGDPEQMVPEDGERMRKLVAYIRKHPKVYLALDDDEAGQRTIRLAAKWLGPKVQIVRMMNAEGKMRNAGSRSQVSGSKSDEGGEE